MLEQINLPLILIAALIAGGSPGPATLAIAGTSMASGRRMGLAIASGITTGSFAWSFGAAFGLAAVMMTNAWVFEVIRYFGAGYLLFLAYKSAKSAIKPKSAPPLGMTHTSAKRAYFKGVMLHLGNPKAILFFGSLYAIGVPAGTSPMGLLTVILAVGIQGAIIFHGYALLFSSAPMTRGYLKLRRWFDGAIAVAFGAAGLKILTAKIG